MGLDKGILSKTIIIIACLTLIGTAGGCQAGTSSAPPKAHDMDKPTATIPSDAEIIQSLSSTGEEGASQNQDILELKHWQDGARPLQDGSPADPLDEPAKSGGSPASSYDRQTTSIQLLTVEEMDRTVQRLIEAGYLDGRPDHQQDYQEALRKFQQDRGLPVTGELDRETRTLLLEQKDG